MRLSLEHKADCPALQTPQDGDKKQKHSLEPRATNHDPNLGSRKGCSLKPREREREPMVCINVRSWMDRNDGWKTSLLGLDVVLQSRPVLLVLLN